MRWCGYRVCVLMWDEGERRTRRGVTARPVYMGPPDVPVCFFCTLLSVLPGMDGLGYLAASKGTASVG